jgi:hypothetical protein
LRAARIGRLGFFEAEFHSASVTKSFLSLRSSIRSRKGTQVSNSVAQTVERSV